MYNIAWLKQSRKHWEGILNSVNMYLYSVSYHSNIPALSDDLFLIGRMQKSTLCKLIVKFLFKSCCSLFTLYQKFSAHIVLMLSSYMYMDHWIGCLLHICCTVSAYSVAATFPISHNKTL